MKHTVEHQKQHLALLLVAVQRSSWFLYQSTQRVHWPLSAEALHQRRKDVDFFATLAAINERFAKLQDILAATMRHTAFLVAEPTDQFLKVLAYFEKVSVLDSVSSWQESRMIRNIAAHEYETDEKEIAEHFNAMADLSPLLITTAKNLLLWISDTLDIAPANSDFAVEFDQLPPRS